MTTPLLDIRGLRKHFGAVTATAALDLQIMPGELHAIIGPNGAGKTTLLGQLAGEVRPDAGTIRFAGQDITSLSVRRRAALGLARSFQISSLFPSFSTLENVLLAVQAHQQHRGRWWRPAHTLSPSLQTAHQVLQTVGLAERATVRAMHLSHGEQRQLDLALALATAPRLLLLDEPTAGMGPEESARMVALLRSVRARYTIVLVEHDMDMVFTLADRITVLVDGRALVTDTPEAIRANVAVRQAYLGAEDDDAC
ncbi:MAG: ABC transporter ATP-binding protein [Candidatus Tectomicrobia bacterium]|uniref:ABC transporter ATP-binding protein n=1 Tax=Tectimicrobiota bacterium TaxID=2528274 RepID=A0A937W3A7_UNCTE|nr:ABC transporter ATP-binding protein [Candidatus Tectomicrobia bacterium]